MLQDMVKYVNRKKSNSIDGNGIIELFPISCALGDRNFSTGAVKIIFV